MGGWFLSRLPTLGMYRRLYSNQIAPISRGGLATGDHGRRLGGQILPGDSATFWGGPLGRQRRVPGKPNPPVPP